MKVRLSELDLADLGDEIWEELYPRAEKVLGVAVGRVLDEARANLARRRGTKRTAAPAGESPEYDTGDLSRSLKPGKVRKSKYSIRQNYGSDHPSAGLHEFGGTITQNGTVRVYPPRPYLRPAEEKARAETDRIMEDL